MESSTPSELVPTSRHGPTRSSRPASAARPRRRADGRGASGCWCRAATAAPTLDLTAQMHVIAEFAQADGSVGWTTMIGGAAPVILGLLHRATFDKVYADGPDVIVGGAFNPTGVATPVDGGYRVTGQWAFASGCQHCHWFVAHCFVDDGRMPPVRMMVLPPSRRRDQGHVVGCRVVRDRQSRLRGERRLRPAEWTFSVLRGRVVSRQPAGKLPGAVVLRARDGERRGRDRSGSAR